MDISNVAYVTIQMYNKQNKLEINLKYNLTKSTTMVFKKRVKLKATGRWRMNGQTTNQPTTTTTNKGWWLSLHSVQEFQ
jgi:outer membrane lipopolysaccharide assembly protein LptE/RlpB